MTTAAARYLEESKIDELVRQLTQQGYEVERPSRDEDFDLVAVKDRTALASGFDEFRLVVVNPPHETRIDVPGLDDQLLLFLGENGSTELDALPGVTRVEDVSYVDIDAVELTTDGTRLVGRGVVSIELEQGGGADRDGVTWETDFPFTFDVALSHDLRILGERSSIHVDTSGFYE